MTITYTIAIDRNDDGDFTGTGETITADVVAATWRLGLEKPFDSIAAPATARITVLNWERQFSPEYTPLLPGHRIRIQSYDGQTTRTHFTGFVSRVEPSPGALGERTAVIHARGGEKWLADSTVVLAPMTGVTADAVIEAALDACALRRPVLAGYLVIGVSGYNTIGMHKLFGAAYSASLETGRSTFAYACGTWGDGIPARRAIWEAATSERGRFFTDRNGEMVFYHRHHTLTDTTSDATFADDMVDLAYTCGGNVVNRVAVNVRPRSLGAANTALWSLDTAQRLRPGQVRRIIARYRDANANPVGADETPYLRAALVEAGASAAILEVWHERNYDVYLTALALRGTPLAIGDPLTLEKTDCASVTFYGLNPLTLDLPLLTSLDEAEQIALYELGKRKDPRGEVAKMTADTRTQAAQVLARTLFDRITVTETQTNHSGDYFIVAEEHQLDRGGTRHRVTWTLEPADSQRVMVIGDGQPDGSRVLAY